MDIIFLESTLVLSGRSRNFPFTDGDSKSRVTGGGWRMSPLSADLLRWLVCPNAQFEGGQWTRWYTGRRWEMSTAIQRRRSKIAVAAEGVRWPGALEKFGVSWDKLQIICPASSGTARLVRDNSTFSWNGEVTVLPSTGPAAEAVGTLISVQTSCHRWIPTTYWRWSFFETQQLRLPGSIDHGSELRECSVTHFLAGGIFTTGLNGIRIDTLQSDSASWDS